MYTSNKSKTIGSLEILNDVGFLGFASLLALVLYLLITNYKDYRSSKSRNLENFDWIYLTVILAVFLQFFPVKSTGSFFTTGNTTYLFLIMGLLVGLIPKQNSIEKNR